MLGPRGQRGLRGPPPAGDHEGGNVSSHTTHLVASALSDPMLSYSAGLAGLAGPLHGLAAQEVPRFVLEMKDAIPANYTNEDVTKFLWQVLNSGRVIPATATPCCASRTRAFRALMGYAEGRPQVAADPMFQLVQNIYAVAPGVLNRARQDQEPVPEPWTPSLGRAVLPQRHHTDQLLHRCIRRLACHWPAGAAELGPDPGAAKSSGRSR
ncbi:hypothetical protein PR048_033793 [Dryococelus australis]|uniref:Citrate synthase n=1 Tax=Dryococelus australis TaxID=614101 RepID=A0ABQ9FYY2_9NEOP|nr:hypothetical protein PR048_033793 [Dryococelus australis]